MKKLICILMTLAMLLSVCAMAENSADIARRFGPRSGFSPSDVPNNFYSAPSSTPTPTNPPSATNPPSPTEAPNNGGTRNPGNVVRVSSVSEFNGTWRCAMVAQDGKLYTAQEADIEYTMKIQNEYVEIAWNGESMAGEGVFYEGMLFLDYTETGYWAVAMMDSGMIDSEIKEGDQIFSIFCEKIG